MNRTRRVAQDDVTATGATVSYGELAAVIEQALDTIASVIPTDTLKENSSIAYVRRRLGVTPEMIARAITASETSPALQPLMDVPDARDTLALRDALRPVLDRMRGITENLKFMIEVRLVKTGGEALEVYAAAQRAARGPNGALVAAHLQSMEAAMPKGKGNRRPRPAAEPSTTTTEPPEDKPS